MIFAARPLAVKVSSSDRASRPARRARSPFSAGSRPFLKEGELHRLPLRLADEAEPRVADARRSAPHRPSEIVPRAGVVVTALEPARPRGQHHCAREMRMLMEEVTPGLGKQPLGPH